MGCWEETCGITNTPIFEGQKVVMVVLDDELGEDQIDLGRFGSWFEMEHITHIVKGKYDHYGWVQDYREAKRGEKISESEKGSVYETAEWMRKAMFHRAAWDAIVEKDPPNEDLIRQCNLSYRRLLDECKDQPKVDAKLLAEFCCVNKFCRIHRRNILGSRNCTLQESRGEMNEGHLFLLELSKKMLRGRK